MRMFVVVEVIGGIGRKKGEERRGEEREKMRGRSSTLHYITDITVFCDGKYKNLASLAGTGFWWVFGP